jgi:hypothetical protein
MGEACSVCWEDVHETTTYLDWFRSGIGSGDDGHDSNSKSNLDEQAADVLGDNRDRAAGRKRRPRSSTSDVRTRGGSLYDDQLEDDPDGTDNESRHSTGNDEHDPGGGTRSGPQHQLLFHGNGDLQNLTTRPGTGLRPRHPQTRKTPCVFFDSELQKSFRRQTKMLVP